MTEPTPVRVTSTPGRLELAVDDWPGEREALEAVFNSTGGQTWAQNDHWTSANVSVCAWFGVKCTSGRVSALNLTGNGLVGEVPLFTLDRLVVLDLSGNALTGIAADALASLPRFSHCECSVFSCDHAPSLGIIRGGPVGVPQLSAWVSSYV